MRTFIIRARVSYCVFETKNALLFKTIKGWTHVQPHFWEVPVKAFPLIWLKTTFLFVFFLGQLSFKEDYPRVAFHKSGNTESEGGTLVTIFGKENASSISEYFSRFEFFFLDVYFNKWSFCYAIRVVNLFTLLLKQSSRGQKILFPVYSIERVWSSFKVVWRVGSRKQILMKFFMKASKL